MRPIGCGIHVCGRKQRLALLFPVLLLLTLGTATEGAAQTAEHLRESAQELPSTTSDTTPTADTARTVDPVRLAIVGGVTLGGFAVGHIVLNNVWWKGEPASFWFNNDTDWDYALGADKVGHAFGTYAGSDLLGRSLLWAGLDSGAAVVWGIGGALFYSTYVEVRDGFSREWGFSPADVAANLIGAGWRFAEHEWEDLRAIRFKISFDPSERFRSGSHNAIIDDYESVMHWAALDLSGAMPDWWPDLIDLAFGHTVRGLDELRTAQHEFYLALDWDLTALPGEGELLEFLKRTANYYHLPAPAVRFSPNVVWFGLKL